MTKLRFKLFFSIATAFIAGDLCANGGKGGGGILIYSSGPVTVTGTIDLNGANGGIGGTGGTGAPGGWPGGGGGGGGGGGSGGGILIDSLGKLTISGTIRANGGSGGTGGTGGTGSGGGPGDDGQNGGVGGNGGGGRLKLFYSTGIFTGATISATGASAGTINYNVKPTTPTLATPADGAAQGVTPTLDWDASTDSDGPDNDSLSGDGTPAASLIYVMQVSRFSDFTTIYFSTQPSAGTTIYASTFNFSNGTYYWRVRAKDDTSWTTWSATRNFTVSGGTDLVITGADWGGADLIPANGDILKGTFTNVGTFRVNSGITVYSSASYTLAVYASSISVFGTVDASSRGYAGGNGGGEAVGGSGGTFGGGNGGNASGDGGAGGGGAGGYGNNGGAGGDGGNVFGFGAGGLGDSSLHGTSSGYDFDLGAGAAGGGGGNCSGQAGGTGNKGGGGVILYSSGTLTISNTGRINLNGGRGGVGGNGGTIPVADCYGGGGGGGGGGSGGGLLIDSLGYLVINGTITANGGDGGSGGGGGGGSPNGNPGNTGGGGRMKLFYPTNGAVAGSSITADGFAAGTINYNLKPSTPTLSSPADSATVGANPLLDWSDSTDNDGPDNDSLSGDGTSSANLIYRLEVSTNVSFLPLFFSTEPTGTSQFTSTAALTNGTTYFWRVRCKDDTSWTTWSSTRSFDVSGLAAPGSPVITNVYTSSVTASWASVATSTGYTLVASTVSTNPPATANIWSSSTTVGNGATTATVYQNNALNPNTTYYLFVRANASGVSSSYTAFSATSTLSNLVTGTSVYQIFISSISVRWDALPVSPSSSTSEGYRLQSSTAADFTGTIRSSETTSVSVSTLTIFTPSLAGNNTYYFRVGSLNHNNVPHYAASTNTFLASVLSVFVPEASLDFGTIISTAVASSSLTVNNDGNVACKYSIRVDSSTPNNIYPVSTYPDSETKFRMSALFNGNTAPAIADFTVANDYLAPANVARSASAAGNVFEGLQSGENVPAEAQRGLWLMYEPPITNTINAQQTIILTISAEQQ